ncbi:MAG: hypothetical protein AB1724_05415 [Thermodesulfobacteriota bacterium]
MINHNSLPRSGFVFLLSVILTMIAIECPADFYRTGTAASIASEYTAMNDASPPQTQVWKVMPESAADGSMSLGFFMEAVAGAQAVCEVILPPSGADGLIRWRGPQNAEKTSDTGLLLCPGFPAPCDIIPIDARDDGRMYQEIIRAGDSAFTRTYTISSETVSIDEARTNGWIRAGSPNVAGDLVMVRVNDDRGRLAVRQLWPANGSWWIYEETPQRRSWLLN